MHHANTNHMDKGETHVPEMVLHKGFGLQSQRKLFRSALGKKLGTSVFGAVSLFNHLVVSDRMFCCVVGKAVAGFVYTVK